MHSYDVLLLYSNNLASLIDEVVANECCSQTIERLRNSNEQVVNIASHDPIIVTMDTPITGSNMAYI